MKKHQNKSGSPSKQPTKTHARSSRSTKQPRDHTIFLKIDRPNVEVLLGHPDQDMPLTFVDTQTGERIEDMGPQTVEAGITYARKNKGPKIITRFGTSAHTAGIDPNRKLLEYDHVLAVDTNTDPRTGKSVSVVVWLPNLRLESDGWKLEPRFPPAFVFLSPQAQSRESHPEKIGWRDAIERIAKSPDLKGRVALFVDSCLGELPAINARERPIVDDFMLPPGIALLYATADTGADEFIGPAAIKWCDQVATRLLRLIQMPASVGQSYHLPVPVEALSDDVQARSKRD